MISILVSERNICFAPVEVKKKLKGTTPTIVS